MTTRCTVCGDPIAVGDQTLTAAAAENRNGKYVHVPVQFHVECILLDTAGHAFGVCACHGFDRSRASARELASRIRQARAQETEV